MVDYAKVNKKWWDEVTPIHASSKLYDLKSFKKGKSSLFSIEETELTDVKGKSMLHLLCHFGMDTLSWARKGAIVTGADISSGSIDLAKKLSEENNIPATFICSDVYDLPKKLHQKFDIVYMSYGVLCWLSDLEKWAQIVSNFLKKDGVLYITELHPFTNMLSSDFNISFPYFDPTPYMDDSEGTYTDWNAPIKGETYVWLHTMGEVLNSLIKAGLTIEFLHEFPYAMYEQFPGLMKKDKYGRYVMKNKEIEIPLLFSLQARK